MKRPNQTQVRMYRSFCEMMDCRAKRGEADREARTDERDSARPIHLSRRRLAGAAQQDDVAAFFKGKTMRLVVGIGVGSGYDINARLLARHMAAHIPGQPDHHRAEPAGRRQPHHDQRALRHRSVRRHGDRRFVQRHADHAAAAARRRPLRSDEAQLARQHQPRDPGHVCLAHRAGAEARRHEDQGDRDGRAGAGLDAVRLSGARQSPVRVQVQGRHRLREHAEDPSRDGERRGARHHRQLVDAQGDQLELDRGEEDPHPRAMGAAPRIPSSATCRCSWTRPRPMPNARRCG